MSNLNELRPVGSLNPFGRFCCTIGNLPSSYMSSLNYEEQLMWFCDYLENTVIPGVNQNAEAVLELQNLYIELKNYVDNYFENLDVQQEINKKLDEMSQDGTLTNLIKNYVDPIYQEFQNQTNNNLQRMQNQISSLASGSPLVAESLDDMTDTTKTYVLTSNGEWYYYNGTQWVSGGVYQTSENSDIVNNIVKNIDNMREFEIGFNQIDTSKSVVGMVQSDGEILTNDAYANYLTSDFIELTETNYNFSCYTILNGNISVLTRGLLLYDNDKLPITDSYVRSTDNNIGITKTSSIKYVRVYYRNVDNPMLAPSSSRSNYIPYQEKYINKMLLKVNNKNISVDNALNAKISKINKSVNLANPNAVTEDTIMSLDGKLISSPLYNTTDYIPVYNNQPISISKCRVYMLYKDIDYPDLSTYNNEDTSLPRTITPNFNGYLRCCYKKDENLQINYGNSALPYTAYDNSIYIEENIKLSNTMINEIKNLNLSVTNDKLKVTINNSNISIESNIDNNKLIRTYKKENGVNNVFNYNEASINNTIVKNSQDDITPQRIKLGNTGIPQWTVGANHGLPCFKILKNNLTVDDIGSVWTDDGETQFILLQIDSTYAYFNYPCSKTDNIITITDPTVQANLTHVSGATHTSELSISNISYGQNLSPSVNNKSLKLFINDNLISENGVYYSNKIKIVEHYEIMDYYELINYLKNHVGNSLDDVKDNITSIVALDYIYEIDELNEIIYSTLTALENVTLQNSGFAQSYVLNANNGVVKRYVNGVASGSFASNGLVDMSNYNTSINIYKSQLSNANIPVNRCVDLCLDNNDDILYGFAFGFIPDIGDSSDGNRKLLNTQWDMRDSKKSYPYCFYEKTLNTGDVLNVYTYRHYILPSQDIVNKTNIEVNKKDYLFIDSISSFNTNIKSDKLGAKISSINNDNIIYKDSVGSIGINIKSSSNNSSGVLKTD